MIQTDNFTLQGSWIGTTSGWKNWWKLLAISCHFIKEDWRRSKLYTECFSSVVTPPGVGVSHCTNLLLFSHEFPLFKRHSDRLFSNSIPNSLLKFVLSNTLLVECILLVFCQCETPNIYYYQSFYGKCTHIKKKTIVPAIASFDLYLIQLNCC